MKSKTIILSANENEFKGARGILTLYSEEDLLKCRIRLYGINKLDKFCKLGIYHNSQVYSANLLEKNGVYTSSFVGEFNIDNDFYTAIVNTNNNNQVIISGGTYAGYYFNQDAKLSENIDFSNIEKADNTTYFEEEKNRFFDCAQNDIKNDCAQSNNEIDVNLDYQKNLKPQNTLKNDNFNNPAKNEDSKTCNCQNCIYKEYFYNNHDITFVNNTNNEAANSEINTTKPQEKENEKHNEENIKSIMQSIVPQFKYVFENYPTDEDLNNLLTNGKFVKISEDNEEYSIGAIYENEAIKYLCYAVKSTYNTPAPKEIGEHYQWLPLDKEDPLTDGYYVVFQDANDLKILEL